MKTTSQGRTYALYFKQLR